MLKKFSVSVAVVAAMILGLGSPAQASPDEDFLTGRIVSEIEEVPELVVEAVPVPQTVFVVVVVPNDAFSLLVQTYCGRSDWQNVPFPGRDKNVIRVGETITLDCSGVAAPAAAPQAQEPAPVASCAGWTPNYWNDEQRINAGIIIQAGLNLGLDKRALIIALMTAMQESTLHNYGWLGDRNDHDSQGLFQQRPSMGWGTVAQVTDPWYASNKFYSVLMTKNYHNMSLTLAAQSVQISAYPYAYAKWESDATGLLAQIACI